MVNTRGTSRISEEKLTVLIRDHFDLTPTGIVKTLGLQRPIFKQTAAYGHFGRDDIALPWEDTTLADTLATRIGLTSQRTV